MAYRVLFEFMVFILPFIGYGLYRLLKVEAEIEGKDPWPINMLFGIGAVLAISVWVVILLRDDRSGELCYEASRFENGELIPARTYECDRNIGDVGVPRSDDPGGEAHGVGSAAEDETTGDDR